MSLELAGVGYRYAGAGQPSLLDIDLVLPEATIVGPVILGSIAEVEERTMALEARGFTRPGRRTLLWSPPDSGIESALRWGLLLALVALIALRATGIWA